MFSWEKFSFHPVSKMKTKKKGFQDFFLRSFFLQRFFSYSILDYHFGKKKIPGEFFFKNFLLNAFSKIKKKILLNFTKEILLNFLFTQFKKFFPAGFFSSSEKYFVPRLSNKKKRENFFPPNNCFCHNVSNMKKNFLKIISPL